MNAIVCVGKLLSHSHEKVQNCFITGGRGGCEDQVWLSLSWKLVDSDIIPASRQEIANADRRGCVRKLWRSQWNDVTGARRLNVLSRSVIYDEWDCLTQRLSASPILTELILHPEAWDGGRGWRPRHNEAVWSDFCHRFWSVYQRRQLGRLSLCFFH